MGRFDLEVLDLPGFGPEEVTIESSGSAITGLSDGRIPRVDRNSGVEQVADTKGRPMGIECMPDGELIVCDARRGLLRIGRNRENIEVLVEASEGPTAAVL